MFDITTFANDLTVNSIEINAGTIDPLDVSLYTKSGTYVGSETNSAPWTLIDTVSVTGQGSGNPTLVDLADFTLSANSVTGMYVFGNGASINYTNGNNTFANSDLQLDLGVGKDDSLFGSTFDERTWNGTINYSVGSTASVPFEFSPSLGLLLVGGLFGSSHLYRKRKAGKVIIDSEV